MGGKNHSKHGETYMLHGVFIGLPRVIRKEGLHMLFNKEVVRRWRALLLYFS